MGALSVADYQRLRTPEDPTLNMCRVTRMQASAQAESWSETCSGGRACSVGRAWLEGEPWPLTIHSRMSIHGPARSMPSSLHFNLWNASNSHNEVGHTRRGQARRSNARRGQARRSEVRKGQARRSQVGRVARRSQVGTDLVRARQVGQKTSRGGQSDTAQIKMCH